MSTTSDTVRQWLRDLILLGVGILVAVGGSGILEWSAHAQRLTRLETKQETTDQLLQEVRQALDTNNMQHLEILKRLPDRGLR